MIFGFNNLIMSVIVEKAAESREQDHAYTAMMRKGETARAKRALYDLCAEIDIDQSGELTIDELQACCKSNTKFVNTLRRIEVDEEATDSYLVRNIIPLNKAIKLYQHVGTVEPDQLTIKNVRTTLRKSRI